MGKSRRQNRPRTIDAAIKAVREIALGLPGAVEGLSYGTPGFRVGKNLFARLHQDGVSLVVKMDENQRAMRMRAEPETFFITDHYRNYPWVLVRLSVVALDDLREVLEDAWRQCAPSRLVKHNQTAPPASRTNAPRKRSGGKGGGTPTTSM
jgi:hypothetical protein